MHPSAICRLACVVAATAATTLRAAPDFEADAWPYFRAHCVGCHGEAKQEGGFRIDTLSREVGAKNVPQWAEVLGRINSGEMPPAEAKPRPAADESAAIVEWLAARLEEGEAARLARRGRVSWNRLTRDEYVNTVRDLIGVHFDAADPSGFPADPEWRGFERLGSVLTLSPSTIEKYLAAAETILAEAYPAEKPKFLEAGRRAVIDATIEETHRERLREQGLLDKVRFEMWPGDWFGHSVVQSLPEAGIYEISYTLSGLKPEHGRAPRLLVQEKQLDRVLFEQDIVAPEDQPITVTFQAHLPKGNPTIHVVNDVPGPPNNFRAANHSRIPFISTKHRRAPWQMKLTDEQGRPRYPLLILDRVSWRGPLLSEQERRRREEYWPAEAGNLDDVRTGLGRLARRAFRRPVSEEELDGHLAIVKSELDAGAAFPDAVKTGMLSILCAKSFLFLTEGAEDADRDTLDDWELASRLSYLLWSTMPDDELFAAAEQGRLRDRAELGRQAARLLADPRARRFSESFATQWLQLRKVGMFQPDKKLYPDYDQSLETSMVGETISFFHEVLERNLSLREFIDSDWTMANARLAGFYGLADRGSPAPAGPEFHRVSLPQDGRRGGLLTQAAILALTSDGTRHRPVHRGKWVLEAIFGRSPPPPPLNIDPIPSSPADAPKATVRMKLEAHTHDPRCASCHRTIDPLGLAFENYDAIGRWRTHEAALGTGADPPVEASGTLSDGRSFRTPAGFKQLVLADIDAFGETFVEKLATYGLRRAMSFADREDLAALARAGREHDYRLRDILMAFVTSDLFQKR
jgi:mono/diheme cytochrome c family protein